MTQKRKEKILEICASLLARTSFTISFVASAVGVLNSSYHAIYLAHPQVQHLEIEKADALRAARGDFEKKKKRSLTAAAKAVICW